MLLVEVLHNNSTGDLGKTVLQNSHNLKSTNIKANLNNMTVSPPHTILPLLLHHFFPAVMQSNGLSE